MTQEPNGSDRVFLSPGGGSLPRRLAALLQGRDGEHREVPFELDELSLALGQRLPPQAQTMTYWQRGDLGRALRKTGFDVRVEQGRVIFVRRAEGGREGGDAIQRTATDPWGY